MYLSSFFNHLFRGIENLLLGLNNLKVRSINEMNFLKMRFFLEHIIDQLEMTLRDKNALHNLHVS